MYTDWYKIDTKGINEVSSKYTLSIKDDTKLIPKVSKKYQKNIKKVATF